MKDFQEIISLLKEYKEEHGNCLVPYSYTTEDGIHLGRIVCSIRTGSRKTSTEEKAMLDSLGFVWKVKERYLSFEEVLKLLKEYKEEYGNCLVPKSYTTEEGIYLGRIVCSIRTGSRKTSTEEKAMLDSLGFVWKVRETPLAFEEVIKLLKVYREKYGDCVVPYSYTTEDGIRLGEIVSGMRTGNRKTSAHEKAMLDSLGFVWKVKETLLLAFNEVLKLLKEYKEKYGDCVVPHSYTTEDGIRLGNIVNHIRTGSRKTSADEKAMLDSLGFVWKVKESPLAFEEVIKHLKEYKEEYGNCLVPYSYTTEDGIRLGEIVSGMRTGNRKISAHEKAMLDSLGFVWKAKERYLSFAEVIKFLKEYKEEYGNCVVPNSYITQDGIRLGKIVSHIRTGGRKTSADEKAILDSLGFVWKAKRGKRKE